MSPLVVIGGSSARGACDICLAGRVKDAVDGLAAACLTAAGHGSEQGVRVRVEDERRRRMGRPGAVLALSISMEARWPAGALAAPPATGAAAAGRDVVDAGDPNAIPDSYIVVVKDAAVKLKGVHAPTKTLAAEPEAKVKHTYVAAWVE
jgi:hypothetical protein